MIPEYEIFGIRYATNQGRTRGQNYILEKNPSEVLALDFYCWFLRGDDRIIVIDTGMNPEKAIKHGHTQLISPPDALLACGIDPQKVDMVILTHLHYDHSGHLASYPNAHFYMQAEEMHYITGEWMQRPWFRRAYEVDEICQAVELLHAGRLTLHKRELDIAPGVSVHWVGGIVPAKRLSA